MCHSINIFVNIFDLVSLCDGLHENIEFLGFKNLLGFYIQAFFRKDINYFLAFDTHIL